MNNPESMRARRICPELDRWHQAECQTLPGVFSCVEPLSVFLGDQAKQLGGSPVIQVGCILTQVLLQERNSEGPCCF